MGGWILRLRWICCTKVDLLVGLGWAGFGWVVRLKINFKLSIVRKRFYSPRINTQESLSGLEVIFYGFGRR